MRPIAWFVLPTRLRTDWEGPRDQKTGESVKERGRDGLEDGMAMVGVESRNTRTSEQEKQRGGVKREIKAPAALGCATEASLTASQTDGGPF